MIAISSFVSVSNDWVASCHSMSAAVALTMSLCGTMSASAFRQIRCSMSHIRIVSFAVIVINCPNVELNFSDTIGAPEDEKRP